MLITNDMEMLIPRIVAVGLKTFKNIDLAFSPQPASQLPSLTRSAVLFLLMCSCISAVRHVVTLRIHLRPLLISSFPPDTKPKNAWSNELVSATSVSRFLFKMQTDHWQNN